MKISRARLRYDLSGMGRSQVTAGHLCGSDPSLSDARQRRRNCGTNPAFREMRPMPASTRNVGRKGSGQSSAHKSAPVDAETFLTRSGSGSRLSPDISVERLKGAPYAGTADRTDSDLEVYKGGAVPRPALSYRSTTEQNSRAGQNQADGRTARPKSPRRGFFLARVDYLKR